VGFFYEEKRGLDKILKSKLKHSEAIPIFPYMDTRRGSFLHEHGEDSSTIYNFLSKRTFLSRLPPPPYNPLKNSIYFSNIALELKKASEYFGRIPLPTYFACRPSTTEEVDVKFFIDHCSRRQEPPCLQLRRGYLHSKHPPCLFVCRFVFGGLSTYKLFLLEAEIPVRAS
jgi:hypothetical protein